MSKERIPFHITAYDGEYAVSHPTDDDFAASVIDISRDRYLLRHAFDTTLFRKADANDDDWTFFTYKRAPKAAAQQIQWLRDVLKNRQYGRLMYWPMQETVPRREEFTYFLFLRNTGESAAIVERAKYRFSWSRPDRNVDICAIEPEAAQALARDIFKSDVNPQLEDPYIYEGDLKADPVEFICGSRKELEALTRWVCHTEAGLYESQTHVYINFNSTTPTTDEGMIDEYLPGPDKGHYDYYGFITHTNRMQTLLDLAFEYNNFTGFNWEYNDYGHGRQSSYSKYPEDVSFTIHAPSAHERAEAWLQLDEWLKGKAPGAERKALLGPKLNEHD